MTQQRISPEHRCCGIQKSQVKEDIRACSETYDDPQARHACYRDVSRSSKNAAVACMSSRRP